MCGQDTATLVCQLWFCNPTRHQNHPAHLRLHVVIFNAETFNYHQRTVTKPTFYKVTLTLSFSFYYYPRWRTLVCTKMVLHWPFCLISIPYPRLNCLKTIPFTAAQTHIHVALEKHLCYCFTECLILSWSAVCFWLIFITESFICQRLGHVYLKKSLLTILSTRKSFVFHRDIFGSMDVVNLF